MVAGKWASRASRMSSAQRVRSFLFFLGKRGDGEGVPAEGVGVAIAGFEFAADGGDPD